jgi:hypothetical protein
VAFILRKVFDGKCRGDDGTHDRLELVKYMIVRHLKVAYVEVQRIQRETNELTRAIKIFDCVLR